MAFARGVDHLDGDELSLPALVVPRPNVSFVYRARDDRLAADGIYRGDLLIIERGQQVKAGRIALITTDCHHLLVRVLQKDGRFTFAEMPDDGSDVELFGIASRVVRFLLP
ncbi:MAG TPA: S24 family peptidase [Thermoanaerobaculia bacterium]|nr:S24 family peptidase [Thermoanaerobaculia bacterium]